MEIEMDSSALQQHHHHQHQQEMSSQTLESMLVCTKAQQEKKPRPSEQALKCPRCDSSNTKFCYYNNYSLTQPRYFCKSCRRYWTKGGTLRNVPVGGGCRKNKRSSSPSTTTTTTPSTASINSLSLSSKIRSQDDHHHQLPLISASSNPSGMINPLLSSLAHLPYHDSTTDLSLAFARLQSQASSTTVGQLGFESPDLVLGSSTSDHIFLGNPQSNSTTHGFLEALQRGVFFEGTPITPNGFHHQNHGFYGGNIGNGERGTNVENGGTHHGMMSGGIGCHEELEMGMNNNSMINIPLFHDHHQQQHTNSASTTGAATTAAVTVTTVKQESSHNARSASDIHAQGQENRVLWGFPWQIGGENGNNTNSMVHHDMDSGRQILGNGWNGLGSTNWQGLLNSPLM